MSENFGNREDETIVDGNRVSCDGGKLGHPKVFLTLKNNEIIICPYCSHKFLKQNKSIDAD